MAGPAPDFTGYERAPVAVVTGAGGMMGTAIATALAAGGAMLVVNDRSPERAGRSAEVVAATARIPHEPAVVVADVATSDGAGLVIDEAARRFGGLDILVNVAGGIKGPIENPIWETTDEQWDATLRVNLATTYHCTRRVVPEMMRQRSGKIVNIASIQWAGAAAHAHYAAAKAAVVSFTRSVATQLGPYNINVNVVAPGGTLTESRSLESFPADDAWASVNPLGRPNLPTDVADAVLFLVSDRARNVSGQVLNVAGGLNAALG